MEDSKGRDFDIAIIGMSARFPGARNVEKFWSNLRDGVESITFFSDEELQNENMRPEIYQQPSYVKAAPILEDIDMFAAEFFGFNAREAALLDPQQRAFLECAWEALENAGWSTEAHSKSIGIYAGAGASSYLISNLLSGRSFINTAEAFEALISNDKDFLTTRAAYKMNLKGPSISVQTACSTSLVAVHLACRSLISYECDIAMAGGVSIRVPQKSGYMYQEGMIFSPDGHCRPFDVNAQGTIFGSGVGVVVLKRLNDAIEDGDHIRAIIKGSAINNDGSWKVGYTAPSVEGQTQVVATAFGVAEVEPETITAIEAHGTGTALGDPIEIAALRKVFEEGTSKTNFCAISSVKSNIGHLDAAAGIAGLIKAVLQLEHKQLVPNLHFSAPNPEIDFANSPFYVNANLSEWSTKDTPRRIGVSSFGIGGTNAHVILEEVFALPPSSEASRQWHVLALSAKTSSALEMVTANLATHLEYNLNSNIADVAYTLQVGRQSFPYRRIVVCKNHQDAIQALVDFTHVRTFASNQLAQTGRPVVFMFAGQGTQYPNMARELYQSETEFRRHIDFCASTLHAHLGYDIRDLLFPHSKNEDDQRAAQYLMETSVAQPVLFALEYSLAKLLETWGVHPQAMIGHSIGEFVAACLSGVFSLEDALGIVAKRGQLIQQLPPGEMLSIPLSADELKPLLSSELSLAAQNAPSLCVVSGSRSAIGDLERQLAHRGIDCRKLHTSHAFHSEMMKPVVEPFIEYMKKICLKSPQIPYISNVTGTWITEEEAKDPSYWGKHICQTVLFSEGIAQLLKGSNRVFLEVGPGHTLSILARQSAETTDSVFLTTVRPPTEKQGDVPYILTSLGRLWLTGVEIHWPGLYTKERRQRVELPTYPFEQRRYWIEPKALSEEAIGITVIEDVPQSEEKAAGGISTYGLHPRPNLQIAYIPPRNEQEKLAAAIWQKLLGIEEVGIYDNFFELGGHSLLATQVLAQVHQKFGVRVPLRTLLENPTIVGLTTLIEQIGNEQTEQDTHKYMLPELVLAPDQRHTPFPLTEMQQAQWIGRLNAFNMGNVAAHVYFESESTHLDLERLNIAWQRVMDRHEMLRAIILPEGQQKILERVPLYEIKVLDLSDLYPESAEAQLKEIRTKMSHEVRPSDQWPLFEVRATYLSGDRLHLHLSFDLMIADIASLRIVARDWNYFYQHPHAELPPLELSFRDYVLAETQMKATKIYSQALEYWQERIKQLPPAIELPLAKSPDTLQNPHFARWNARLPEEVWSRIKRSTVQLGLTPSAVLLTAFAYVLAAWSKSAHFSLNVTVINRLPFHPQVQDIIGEFASFDLLEVDFTTPRPFEEMVKHVQEQSWDDLEHRYVNGVRILRELARSRGGTSGAVMPVVFTSTLVQKSPDGHSPMHWLGKTVHLISQTPQVWLDHSVLEDDGALELNWHAAEELFPEGMLNDMFHAYHQFLESLAWHEESWKESIHTWLPVEQHERRIKVNDTAALLSNELLYTRFLHQVAQRPQQPAVIASERTLSYAELYQRSQQLAQILQKMEVRPNSLIAVVMEKGWEQVVAVLGILLAGAAYLPIDSDVPTERLHYLLENGQATVALTQSWLVDKVAWPENVQAYPVDADIRSDIDTGSLELIQEPDDLAYVIFTSGSTGLPKGVAITHRSAVNTIIDMNHRFAVGPQDRVLALSSLNFDLSVYDIFGLLAAGGSIVFPKPGAERDPAHWSNVIQEQQITLWNSVPAFMAMLVEFLAGSPQAHTLPLRLVLLSGDWIPVQLPERLQKLIPDVHTISLGGATEAAIWSIFYSIDKVNPNWESIPYGKPLRNQWFAVLNEWLEPSPIWVPGQLYIGGIGLAQGYWRDEKKTQESFITHPRTGLRLYRTGDLGRYLPSGDIEFLGREDHQVKVNGYRIELGEIEAALTQLPQVQAAIVSTVGERNQRRLVAYIVLQRNTTELIMGDEQGMLTAIRSQLEKKLPSYMIPTHIITLEYLPLTPNGKINRKALPAPDYISTSSEEEISEATGALINKIATIVSEVLGIEQVGIHDNFFEMGGDSILGIQIITRANAQGLQITPQQLFEHQTIAKLVRAIVQNVEKRDEQGQVTGSVPLSPWQMRIFAENEQNMPHGNLCIRLTVPSSFDYGIAEQALQYLIAYHDALRLRLLYDEGQWTQFYIDDVTPFILMYSDLGTLESEEQELAMKQILANLEDNLNIEQEDPLIAVAFVELGQKPGQLIWYIHPLIADAVSLQILLQDFYTAYEQLLEKQEVILPAKTASFKQWTELLMQHSESDVLSPSEAKWLSLSPNMVCSLPIDDQMTNVVNVLEQSITVSLTPEDTRALLEDVPRAYYSEIIEILLAALADVFAIWTKQSKQFFDVEHHGGRTLFENLNVSHTVGAFTTTYPLLLDVPEVRGPGELLRYVKEQVRSIPNFGMSYDGMRFYSKDRDLSQKLDNLPHPDVRVRNLGMINIPFELSQPCSDAVGLSISGYPYLLEVITFVYADQLHIRWEYSNSTYKFSTISRLANHFLEQLKALIIHCQSPEAGGHTPSDFPLAELEQKELDTFLSIFNQLDEREI